MRQQLRRPPAATDAEYSINRRIGKRRMQIVQTISHRARIVERSAIKRMRTQNGLITKRVQMIDTAMHQFSLRRARR